MAKKLAPLVALAEAEYINKFFLTCDLVEAEKAYRVAVGKLEAAIPEELQERAANMRIQMLETIQKELLKVKREEWKEYKMLHAQALRILLEDDFIDTGVPDNLDIAQLRSIEPDDLAIVVKTFQSLQEMRRGILST